jgi:hypothetical protein
LIQVKRPGAAVTLCVLLHYEGLLFTSTRLAQLHVGRRRVKVLYAILSLLAGFVLITWSASFTYLEMERFWRRP